MGTKDIKILFRHPDANVRRLPPKPLEIRNKDGETDFFVPEQVNTNKGVAHIYTVPLEFGRRLLANQPDRYFLLEPAQVMVKRKLPGGLSSDFVTVTNKVAASLLAAEDPDAVAAKAAQDEADRIERQRLAKEAADKKAREEAEAEEQAKRDARDKADQEAQDKAAADRRAADEDAAMKALEADGADAPAVGDLS